MNISPSQQANVMLAVEECMTHRGSNRGNNSDDMINLVKFSSEACSVAIVAPGPTGRSFLLDMYMFKPMLIIIRRLR